MKIAFFLTPRPTSRGCRPPAPCARRSSAWRTTATPRSPCSRPTAATTARSPRRGQPARDARPPSLAQYTTFMMDPPSASLPTLLHTACTPSTAIAVGLGGSPRYSLSLYPIALLNGLRSLVLGEAPTIHHVAGELNGQHRPNGRNGSPTARRQPLRRVGHAAGAWHGWLPRPCRAAPWPGATFPRRGAPLARLRRPGTPCSGRFPRRSGS